MNSEIRKMFCDLLGEDRVFTEEAMSQHTTFKIGSVKRKRFRILSLEMEAIFL